jgi:hypothetical protein
MSTNYTPKGVLEKLSSDLALVPTTSPPSTPLAIAHLVSKPSPKLTGFFQQLLGGRPELLLSLIPKSSSHTDQIQQLLEELQAGARSYESLHPEERMLLDAATAEAVTQPRMKKRERKTPPVLAKRARAVESVGSSTPTGPDNLPAFWWV